MFTMPHRLCPLGALLLVCAGLLSCGQKDAASVPKTSKAAATQIDQAFAHADDPQARRQAEMLSDALRRHEYEKAYQAMQALQQAQAKDFNQVVAVENAHRWLQADLLRGVEAGDPKALRIWQQMKRGRRD